MDSYMKSRQGGSIARIARNYDLATAIAKMETNLPSLLPNYNIQTKVHKWSKFISIPVLRYVNEELV